MHLPTALCVVALLAHPLVASAAGVLASRKAPETLTNHSLAQPSVLTLATPIPLGRLVSDPVYIFYDTDSADAFCPPDELYITGSEWAVRFSPRGPCLLAGFDVATYDILGNCSEAGCPIGWRLYKGDTTGPITLIAEISVLPVRGVGWDSFEFYNPIDIGPGDFFISFVVGDDSPYLLFDTANVSGRSWYTSQSQPWDWFVDINLKIGAYVYYTGTGVLDQQTVPASYELLQNYPNPFNPRTTIEYALPAAAPVALAIYNVRGQRVRSLDLGMQGPGSHRLEWDGCDDHGRSAASGMYYYRLTAGDQIRNRKMVLLK